MPRGYWIAGIAALGFVAVIGALEHAEYRYQQRETAYYAAHPEEKYTPQIATRRAGFPALAEAIASNPNPPNADEKDNRDLAAQESMSLWAFWLLVIGFGQLLATGIGLWYVNRTLRLTSRQIVVENRPWVTIRKLEVHSLKASSHAARFEFTVELENVGRTPALRAAIEIVAVNTAPTRPIEPEIIARTFRESYSTWPADGFVIMPESKTTRTLTNKDDVPVSSASAVLGTAIEVLVVATVCYRTEIDNRLIASTTKGFIVKGLAANLVWQKYIGFQTVEHKGLTVNDAYHADYAT